MNSSLHFPEDMSHLSSRGRESVSTEDLVQLFDNWDVKGQGKRGTLAQMYCNWIIYSAIIIEVVIIVRKVLPLLVAVPSSKEAAPFEPSRTVNVSSTKWEYYRRQNHRREGQQMFGSKKEHKIESQK
jgi:hypothetical protein